MGLRAGTLPKLINKVREKDSRVKSLKVSFKEGGRFDFLGKLNMYGEPAKDSEIVEWRKGNLRLTSFQVVAHYDVEQGDQKIKTKERK